jgi:hypothetical protein
MASADRRRSADTRPRKIVDVHEIRIGADVLALLKHAAKTRGVSTQRLAGQILAAVAVDQLVDAVIDDKALRQEL